MIMYIKTDVSLPQSIVTALGLNPNGPVQLYLTHEIRRRMTRYMPYRTGTLATKLTAVDSATSITVRAPYAEWLYNGLRRDGTPIHYTKTFNPAAGPKWDQTLMAAEKEAIAAAVKNYAGRKTI
jgi:hypothetical protein